jgi:predicted nucleic acid-binding Zn ribbon protein
MGNQGRQDTSVKKSDPEKIGDFLSLVLEKGGLAKQIARNGILEKWESVAGTKIARVTEASAVQGDTLFVEVRSSIWLTELSFIKNALLVKINQGLDDEAKIERIIFRLMEK